VATDDLNTPLGLNRPQARFRLSRLAMLLAAGFLGAILVVFLGWGLFGNDPFGGEPMAVVSAGATADGAVTRKLAIAPNPGPESDSGPNGPAPAPAPAREAAQKSPTPQEKRSPGAAGAAGSAGPAEQIVTIIDGKSGARQEVRIPAGSEAGTTGGSGGSGGADPQLIEMTRNGPIPRIAADGLRAAQAYAKPMAAKPNAPQIAIVMSGLGVSVNGTTDAVNKLPAAITFAFLPYGSDLEKLTAKADGLGHELLVQVPMQPFDYPDNDPGPQTLITSLPPAQNIDRLQWAMSRFQRYVGVANFMGARFTASELSLLPILREIGKRGLIYVDDGSAPRSLASQIAGGNSLAFAKASLVLDSVPSASEIDRALVRLEGIARSNGIAVGFAGALPVTIERVARWAKTAEGRGFALVPITAAVGREKPS
jgi:polysaccharide deacetylase 2 family uncharacterized protein YibQ